MFFHWRTEEQKSVCVQAFQRWGKLSLIWISKQIIFLEPFFPHPLLLFIFCIKRSEKYLSQIILWIGLGVLVISTYTTLLATEDIPAKIETVEPGKLPGEIQKILNPDSVKISGMHRGLNPPYSKRAEEIFLNTFAPHHPNLCWVFAFPKQQKQRAFLRKTWGCHLNFFP